MTEYHNVDLTIAAENGIKEKSIKNQIEQAIRKHDNNLEDQKLEEVVMISKVEEVEQ